jgi:hypothetical protein
MFPCESNRWPQSEDNPAVPSILVNVRRVIVGAIGLISCSLSYRMGGQSSYLGRRCEICGITPLAWAEGYPGVDRFEGQSDPPSMAKGFKNRFRGEEFGLADVRSTLRRF